MAITIDDFSKIWASTSPLTPYSFSESNYKEGWNFIGGTPPSRQMWDFLQKQNDEKFEYLLNNFDDYAKKTDLDDYLPLSGGTLTGAINTANSTWNKLGDDASFGDHNVVGKMCIKTQTSTNTGIAFFNSSDTNVGQVEVNNEFNFNKTIKQSGTAVSLSGHTHSYLPLSGGTMSGEIKGNPVTLTAESGEDSSSLVLGADKSMTWNGVSLTDGSLLTVRSVSLHASQGGSAVKIGTATAPAVSGYQFVCWFACASDGGVYPCYAAEPELSTTDVWGNGVAAGTNVLSFALYVRKW